MFDQVPAPGSNPNTPPQDIFETVDKTPSPVASPKGEPLQPMIESRKGMNTLTVVIIILAIIVVILIVGVWLLRSGGDAVPQSSQRTVPEQAALPQEVATEVTTLIIDSDFDGLSDTAEVQAGTDPQRPDTDVDGLTDGEEVNIWKTNPKNPDSDGDTFIDGQEVKGGYNPKGTGKLSS